jgi:pSer/pThr/pTyr-binding forkhead associated (FHA) protein
MVGAKIMLKDLQSTNGTYVHDGSEFQQVNGSVPVKLKTMIKFGTSTIVQLVRETETFYEH